MGRLVVDSSAFVDLLTADPDSARLDPYLSSDAEFHVPEICDVEFTSGVLRGLRGGALDEDKAAIMLLDYASLPIVRHRHLTFLGRLFELRDNFSAADSTYVALAERLGADFLTADRRLARAVRRHTSVTVLL